jgi:hypothetical protein
MNENIVPRNINEKCSQAFTESSVASGLHVGQDF